MVSPYDKNLSKKSPTLESRECFSLNEVRKKLNVVYSKNKLQLLQHAGRYCRKLKKTEPEDLINETYKRFLEGTRTWKKGSKFIQTFKGAMQSIADEKYESENLDKRKFVSEKYKLSNNKDYSIYENTPDQAQNQEEEIIYKQEKTQFNEMARNLLTADQVAKNFFHLYYLGDYTRKEIMEKLQINSKQYNTVYKKVHRRIIKLKE